MKNLQRVSLIFMTSFSAFILLLFLWIVITINPSWLTNALQDSHYDELIYTEIQAEMKQVIPQYGINENALDALITKENTSINIDRNLSKQEPLILSGDILSTLERVVDEMGISLTEDVEYGIIELTGMVNQIFQDRTRIPLQDMLIDLVEVYNDMRWWIMSVLFGLFGIFCFSLYHQSVINLSIALKASILSFMGVLITLFIVITVYGINLSPYSLAQLMTSLINGFLLRGALFIVLIIGLYRLTFNRKTFSKLKTIQND